MRPPPPAAPVSVWYDHLTPSLVVAPVQPWRPWNNKRGWREWTDFSNMENVLDEVEQWPRRLLHDQG